MVLLQTSLSYTSTVHSFKSYLRISLVSFLFSFVPFSFVALLDAAEEHLGCTQVIIGLRQDAVDRAQLIRTFKFMGFELVPPSHPELPSLADYLFMVSDI